MGSRGRFNLQYSKGKWFQGCLFFEMLAAGFATGNWGSGAFGGDPQLKAPGFGTDAVLSCVDPGTDPMDSCFGTLP